MIFSKGFKSKVRKELIVLLCVAVVATVWYFEKSKRILQYGAVFYEMGLNCEDKCGLEKQLEYFQRALYYNPNQIDAHYRSALIYEKDGNYAKAFEYFIRATETDYWNTLAYYKVGLYYFREGAYDHARRYFLQAVKSRIGIPDDTSYYLARIYDYLKEYDLAARYYCNFVLSNAEYAPEIYPRVAEIYYLYLGEDAIAHMLHVMRHWKHYALADQLEQHFEGIKFSKTSSVLSDNN
ncbi:MAG: hypothetical protein KAR31_01830 [Candidatus Omnitrophica bacterium]|nr:hypothetical protein [Candidatus Omnitrophota bacterium]